MPKKQPQQSNTPHFLLVESPNGQYSGQKLIKLVSMKMPANINNTIARVPERTPAKYNPAMTSAIIILTTLSMVPIFLVIVYDLMSGKIDNFAKVRDGKGVQWDICHTKEKKAKQWK